MRRGEAKMRDVDLIARDRWSSLDVGERGTGNKSLGRGPDGRHGRAVVVVGSGAKEHRLPFAHDRAAIRVVVGVYSKGSVRALRR